MSDLKLAPEQPPRILVVDDEPFLVDLLADLLEEEGFVVLRAYDGEQALAMAESDCPPDLVLSDVMMPRLSGTELVAAVRRRLPDGAPPFVLLSAGARPDIRWENVVFLPKLADLEQILRAVERLLTRPARRRPSTTDLAKTA